MPNESREVMRLPLPERLEPTRTTRSLMASVRIYFYALYNAADDQFRKYLAAVGNKDSLTGKRLFDRHEAVIRIKKAAMDKNDTSTGTAKDGDIDDCLSKLMSKNGLGLKLRRREYQRLTHAAPAE